MNKYIIARHFVNGEEELKGLIKGIGNLKSLINISETTDYGFEFGLKLTVNEERLTQDLLQRINDEIEKFPHNFWFLYDPKDRGAGTSYKQILFNLTFPNQSIIVMADIDSYITGSEDCINQIYELTERVKIEGALFGMGARDIPVKLGVHKKNSDLRIIHELYHSLTIGSDKLRVKQKKLNITPAYAEIGESTTGVCVMNFSHPKYSELIRDVVRASQIADMNGFATDYYVSIRSSELGKRVVCYVNTNENEFYNHSNRTEEQELNSITRMIGTQTKELGKTNINSKILKTLKQEENKRRIAEFYPLEYVEFVRDLMIKSLE